MHSPQVDKTLEDQFTFSSLDDLGSFFPDGNSSFTYAEKPTMNDNIESNESTCGLNTFLAQTPKEDGDANPLGDTMLPKLDSTSPGGPISSQSNPETPKGQFEFSLGDSAPAMTRFFSEQSGLASLNPKQADHSDNVHQTLLKNQQQKHQLMANPNQLMATPMSRTNSHQGWTPNAGTMASSEDNSLPTPAISYNQHQAGLDAGVQNGFGARHSYIRTPLRPSGLRNSLSSQPATIYPSNSEVAEPNPQFMQTIADNPTTHELPHRYRNRRYTDAQVLPRIEAANPYSILDQNQAYGGFMGDLTNYADPARVYSLSNPPRSVYHSQGMNGTFVHPTADSYQPMSGMLMPPPTNIPTYINRPHHLQPTLGQRIHHTMKRMDITSDPSPQRVRHQSVEETGKSKGVRNQERKETPPSTLTPENYDEYYRKTLAAMYDTSHAQDNAGMISTWKTQMADSEAVEKIAHDLLVSVKKLGVSLNNTSADILGLGPLQKERTTRGTLPRWRKAIQSVSNL